MAASVPATRLGVIGGFIYLRPVYSLRLANLADAEALGRAVPEGVQSYRDFAGEGWTPPSAEEEAEHARELLVDADAVCLVAEDAAGLAGQITVLPAARAGRPADDPGLAHLSNLFVREDLWGSGLARALHDAALHAARERGFTTMRLFVAAGQARARRFYEREGWAAAAEPFHEERLGLDMVEYRRPL
jgi:GNAT superfamily N-acetyltransferase